MSTDPFSITLHRTLHSDRGTARRLQRMATAGTLARIRRGVFADPAVIAGLDSRGRHVLLVRAALPRLPQGSALSHLSAVAVRGWPHIGAWPELVHVTTADPRAARARDRVVVHRPGAPALGTKGRFEGVPVMSARAVAVDIARTLPFHEALVVVDHVLRAGLADPDRLESYLDDLVGTGRARAAAVLAAANATRESVGESYCAARLIQLGAPPAVEQHVFRYADGSVDRVDFFFAELGIVLEFDGRQKYEDTEMLAGRSPQRALWDEKRREDRIRARPEVRGFIRVTWWHLVDPDRLRALLREHGVPLR